MSSSQALAIKASMIGNDIDYIEWSMALHFNSSIVTVFLRTKNEQIHGHYTFVLPKYNDILADPNAAAALFEKQAGNGQQV